MPDRALWLLLVLGVLAPVLITGLWGDVYADAAYHQFQRVRAIARSGEWSWGGFGLSPSGDSPLYTLSLRLVARSPSPALTCPGGPLPAVALTLSVLGWIAAVVSWFWTGLVLGRPTFSVAATVLLVLHPLQPQVLGLESGLALGLWGLVAWWAVQGQSTAMLVTMIILVATQPIMLAFVVPLFVYGQVWRRSPPTLAHITVSLIIGAAGYSLVCVLNGGCHEPRLTALLLAALQLLAAAGFALLVPHLDWLMRPGADRWALQRGMVSLSLITLTLWQGNTLLQNWRMRPTDRLALYKATAQWLCDHTLPTETVGAQQAGLLGYLSDRTTVALPASATTQAPAILAAIDRTRPDYCVALNSLVWQGVRSQPWFRERYHQVYQLTSPYDSATPLTVFRYTPSPFDAGETISTTARFVPDAKEQIELNGYRLDTRRITPGEPLHLTLYWHIPTPVHKSLSLVARLTDPVTDQVWTQAENRTPGGLETDLWNAGMRFTDRYVLVPPANLPSGDYALDVAFYPRNGGSQPVLAANKGDSLRREPLILTQVYRPPNVNTVPLTPDHSLRVTFGREVELIGYDAPQRVAPGATLRVALYWHTLQPMSLDYKVFVHLLASDDQLLAQGDSMPVNWSYPTTRWQPGEYIRDEHLLVIDSSAPRGDYVLSVGLYDPATGERPVVRDDAGNEIAERRVMLQQIQVR